MGFDISLFRRVQSHHFDRPRCPRGLLLLAMAFLRLLLSGAVISQLLSTTNLSWLVPGIGVAGLVQNGIPPQAQVIDQRTFNVLHNVPSLLGSDGNAVCIWC
jgi:hypothetical protein